MKSTMTKQQRERAKHAAWRYSHGLAARAMIDAAPYMLRTLQELATQLERMDQQGDESADIYQCRTWIADAIAVATAADREDTTSNVALRELQTRLAKQ